MKRLTALTTVAVMAAASAAIAADRDRPVVVTSSNTEHNQLLVYDTGGRLLGSVPTRGQGGVAGNSGGIATDKRLVAVVNFGSQNVSLFARSDAGFELRQIVPTSSAPVSVAFGKDHLYVLGTATVESHRIGPRGVEEDADGTVALLAADGSAAQVGVVGDRLIATEKSGTIEGFDLRDGAVVRTPVPVDLPPDRSDTPFGLVTRGSTAYVTIARSDLVGVVKAGRLTGVAATGTPGGQGQHSPCWIALVGPYLFTTNSPSHSISRLVAAGPHIVLDEPVAARTAGAPIDIAATGELVAVVEADGDSASHLTQFRLDDGNLVRTTTTAIPSAANGVAIIGEK